MEFLRCATQLCGISKREVLFFLEFPKGSGKWTIPEKNQTGRVEEMEFLGISKRYHVKFPGVYKNEVEFPGFPV